MGILHLNYRTKKGWSFIDKIQIKKKPTTIDDFLKVFEVYKMINGGVSPEPPTVKIYPPKVKLYEKKKVIKQLKKKGTKNESKSKIKPKN